MSDKVTKALARAVGHEFNSKKKIRATGTKIATRKINTPVIVIQPFSK